MALGVAALVLWAASGGAAITAQPAQDARLSTAVTVVPTGKAGTHENTLGLHLETAVRRALGARQHDLRLRAGVGAEVLVEDLGIPGPSVGAQGLVELGYAFGPSHPSHPAGRAHEAAYYLVAYLDTDRTSQLSGGLRYRRTAGTWSLGVQFENDALAQQLLDRYRTFALRVRYLRLDRPVPVGVGARAVVWAGTTEGLGRLGRDEVYDLRGQRGGDQAHGVLALDLVLGALTLSLGADSEGIRSTLQNSFHYLIDDGQIPRLPDRPARLFVRIALHETGGLY